MFRCLIVSQSHYLTISLSDCRTSILVQHPNQNQFPKFPCWLPISSDSPMTLLWYFCFTFWYLTTSLQGFNSAPIPTFPPENRFPQFPPHVDILPFPHYAALHSFLSDWPLTRAGVEQWRVQFNKSTQWQHPADQCNNKYRKCWLRTRCPALTSITTTILTITITIIFIFMLIVREREEKRPALSELWLDSCFECSTQVTQ